MCLWDTVPSIRIRNATMRFRSRFRSWHYSFNIRLQSRIIINLLASPPPPQLSFICLTALRVLRSFHHLSPTPSTPHPPPSLHLKVLPSLFVKSHAVCTKSLPSFSLQNSNRSIDCHPASQSQMQTHHTFTPTLSSTSNLSIFCHSIHFFFQALSHLSS